MILSNTSAAASANLSAGIASGRGIEAMSESRSND
jgi:hypothetical protein